MGTMRSVIQAPLVSSLLLCIAVSGIAQTADSGAAALSSWTQADKADALHGTSFREFTLEGKFLVPPRQSSLSAPVLVLHCQPGRHTHGKVHTNGHFVEGWIAAGSVLD